jgi:hypothetical protein
MKEKEKTREGAWRAVAMEARSLGGLTTVVVAGEAIEASRGRKY